MKQPTTKEYYATLGIDPNASVGEIRAAYLARTRVIHPDRFDQKTQPLEWKKANEMLAELNEAYSILRNPVYRNEYDQSRMGRQQRQTESPPLKSEPQPAFELGELTPGQTSFNALPKIIQERLLKRQAQKSAEQFKIKLESTVWNYIFITLLLIWFWYLYADADEAKWKESTLQWYAGFTIIVGLLIGRNLLTILRWTKASLKSYFYITPIYFIKTEYDIVSFRPIWSLKDIAVTHKYTNGLYQGSDVVLKFDGNDESLFLSKKHQVDTMFERLRTYDSRLRNAYKDGNHEYFLKNDDFFHVPRTKVPITFHLSKWNRLIIYGSSLFICIIGLGLLSYINDGLSRKPLVHHPAAEPYFQIQNQKNDQENPTTLIPSNRNLPSPSFPEKPLPNTGSLQIFNITERIAPFEIKASKGSHYLVKLVEYNKVDSLTVFVRSGTTVNIDVPLGTYEVRYASGENWYGYENRFGPGTQYSKADKTFTFEIVGDQISGFTITLYTVRDGNLSTSSIKPIDF